MELSSALIFVVDENSVLPYRDSIFSCRNANMEADVMKNSSEMK